MWDILHVLFDCVHLNRLGRLVPVHFLCEIPAHRLDIAIVIHGTLAFKSFRLDKLV